MRAVVEVIVVATVAATDWPSFAMSPSPLECVLHENVVRSARKKLMEKVAALRVSGEVEVNSECRVIAKVKAVEAGDTVLVSMALLVAIGKLHVPAQRLQAFRHFVARVKVAAELHNTRAPSSYGDKKATTGELGTEVMLVLLKSNPTTTVWRTRGEPGDAADENSGLTANLLFANMGDVCMSNDFQAVNHTILRRWVRKKRPLSYALPCFFFSPLLLPPRGPTHAAAVSTANDTAANEAFRWAGIV
eukprot:TRINITY_DN6813_c0_g1_i2.p1 TRINITY_DN6813_c0_g1~~TRINITY_DN6813_c0_g1_i2.p1  ORF type:complete len:247 (+),score=55.56 TRINITY_DN6813_c0_g1_i2:450-1190(+)